MEQTTIKQKQFIGAWIWPVLLILGVLIVLEYRASRIDMEYVIDQYQGGSLRLEAIDE